MRAWGTSTAQPRFLEAELTGTCLWGDTGHRWASWAPCCPPGSTSSGPRGPPGRAPTHQAPALHPDCYPEVGERPAPRLLQRLAQTGRRRCPFPQSRRHYCQRFKSCGANPATRGCHGRAWLCAHTAVYRDGRRSAGRPCSGTEGTASPHTPQQGAPHTPPAARVLPEGARLPVGGPPTEGLSEVLPARETRHPWPLAWRACSPALHREVRQEVGPTLPWRPLWPPRAQSLCPPQRPQPYTLTVRIFICPGTAGGQLSTPLRVPGPAQAQTLWRDVTGQEFQEAPQSRLAGLGPAPSR